MEGLCGGVEFDPLLEMRHRRTADSPLLFVGCRADCLLDCLDVFESGDNLAMNFENVLLGDLVSMDSGDRLFFLFPQLDGVEFLESGEKRIFGVAGEEYERFIGGGPDLFSLRESHTSSDSQRHVLHM